MVVYVVIRDSYADFPYSEIVGVYTTKAWAESSNPRLTFEWFSENNIDRYEDRHPTVGKALPPETEQDKYDFESYSVFQCEMDI